MKFSIGRPCIHRAFAPFRHKHLDHAICRPLRSFSVRLDPVSACRASCIGFVAQPSNPDGFVVNRCKPRGLGVASTIIPLVTWPPRHPGSVLVLWSKPTKHRVQALVVSLYPTPAPIHDFVLLFLPPCGLHFISFSHRVHQVEPICLSTPRRPHRLGPFAPALHMHQRKSCRNLHLQYSTKS
jgi:hypothetical protein